MKRIFIVYSRSLFQELSKKLILKYYFIKYWFIKSRITRLENYNIVGIIKDALRKAWSDLHFVCIRAYVHCIYRVSHSKSCIEIFLQRSIFRKKMF